MIGWEALEIARKNPGTKIRSMKDMESCFFYFTPEMDLYDESGQVAVISCGYFSFDVFEIILES